MKQEDPAQTLADVSANAYVMIPDQTTVDKAKVLMKKVREGFMLSEADVAR